MSMKLLAALVAFVAFIGMASADLFPMGNGLSMDVPYIVTEGTARPVDLTVEGVHFQGTVLDLFPGSDLTYIGTVTYVNGSIINSPYGAGSALGGALAIVGVQDFSDFTPAVAADGTVNGVTRNGAAKTGTYNNNDYVLLVIASTYNGGTDVVSYLKTAAIIEDAKSNEYRASSF